MNDKQKPIVILGAGPAGCTLASLLALRGIETTVFDNDKRPELLVGESLIPGVVNVFRQLGIEERVAEFSMYKPGASFFCRDGTRLHFNFKSVAGSSLPTYSYNSPRPELDNLLRKRAEELGVKFVSEQAEVVVKGERAVGLGEKSLQAAGIAAHEDPFIIDASGRSRTIARKLNLPSKKGNRDDVAYFAHFENFIHDEVAEPGQIIISVLESGWSWRIPLKGKLSVGVVLNKDYAKTLGATAEERLLEVIRREPLLREKGENAKRVSEVMSYTNYQLQSEVVSGENWLLIGDALSFVDPMLSPGLFLSLEGARVLDEVLFSKGMENFGNQAWRDKKIKKYGSIMNDWHEAWTELVEYFYDGRIFRIYLSGKSISENYSNMKITRMMEHYSNYQIACMASGGKTRSTFSRHFLKFLDKYLIWDVPEASVFSVNDRIASINV
jgi:flavin-dependent dehydrogenase